MSYKERLLKSIPGGAHTYSRGHDQFPSNVPEILDRGKGVYVYGLDNLKLLDYGMGLRSVNIGYAEEEIDEYAIAQIRKGNNLTRPSMIELDAAELMVDLIDSADMVKFAKNGSTVVSAAVKLARAFTGRNIILACSSHPFFSYDDWFISSTTMSRGIPNEVSKLVKKFEYNDIESLKMLVDEFQGQISCLVMEPATVVCPANGEKDEPCCENSPCQRKTTASAPNFLKQVEQICNQNGIVFILDEMITGFRWHLKGAQYFYDVKPDLSTFGKGMANGYSVACLAGKAEIMQLGSIDLQYEDRVFLTSTTHGAEMSSLGAFIGTVNYMKENSTIERNWDYGRRLKEIFRSLILEYQLESMISIHGPACSPIYSTFTQDGKQSLGVKTLFMQEMISHGVLMPWIAIAHRHGDRELASTEYALRRTFETLIRAQEDGYEKFLTGPVVSPVFRK